MNWIFERLGFEFKGRAGHFYLTNSDLQKSKLEEWIDCFKKENLTKEQIEEFKTGFIERQQGAK